MNRSDLGRELRRRFPVHAERVDRQLLAELWAGFIRGLVVVGVIVLMSIGWCLW